MKLDFRTFVKAKQCCQHDNCVDCPLGGYENAYADSESECGKIDLSEEIVDWLTFILERLDRIEKNIDEVSDSEFLSLIYGEKT